MSNNSDIALLVLLGIGAFALSRNASAAFAPGEYNPSYPEYTPPYLPPNDFNYANNYWSDDSETTYIPFDETPLQPVKTEASMTANLDAFLRAIRVGEGASDERGYYRLVGGSDFRDDSVHPSENKIEFPPGAANAFRNGGFYNKALNSTASGAYQITYSTWKLLRNKYGAQEFSDFSPLSQDNAAIRLIAEKPGAMNDVLNGRIDDAVYKVRRIWESLPGSGTRPQNEVSIAQFKDYYRQYGGVLA